MTASLDVLRQMGRVLPGSQGQAVRDAVAELEMEVVNSTPEPDGHFKD